jgi:hypothetical protein
MRGPSIAYCANPSGLGFILASALQVALKYAADDRDSLRARRPHMFNQESYQLCFKKSTPTFVNVRFAVCATQVVKSPVDSTDDDDDDDWCQALQS